MDHSFLLAALVPSLCSLAALWMILRFLWRVYRDGGAADMRSAAEALRLVRPQLGLGALRRKQMTGVPQSREAGHLERAVHDDEAR